MSELAKEPLKLFYCYAHEDKTLRDTLDRHLSSLKRQKLLKVWYDREISAGIEWENEIDAHLNTSDIVLLLVSADFLASDYCYGKEMERALQRQEQGSVRVIPIILRPVDWEDAPFSKLQILPTEAKPVTRWTNIDDAYEDIAKEIRKVVKELHNLPKTAEEWFQKGENLRNSERYAEAIPAYNQAIRLNSKDAVTYTNKGFALDELKRYEEAIEAYEEAIRLSPNDAVNYNNKGVALKQLERYEEAIEAYEEAIRLDSEGVLAYYNKGLVLEHLGRYEEAVKTYDKVVQIKPNNINIYFGAYYKKGLCLGYLERYEESIEAFAQANPNDADTYYNKGVALGYLERYEEAVEAYEEAIRLNPNEAGIYLNKGIVLRELKRYSEAQIAFEKAELLR